MDTIVSTVYMLQDNNTKEFFTNFGYWKDGACTIPVLFGAMEFQTEEEAFQYKTEFNHFLENFSVVKRCSTVSIEKV